MLFADHLVSMHMLNKGQPAALSSSKSNASSSAVAVPQEMILLSMRAALTMRLPWAAALASYSELPFPEGPVAGTRGDT